MFGYILVPELVVPIRTFLRIPIFDHRFVDDINGFDQKGGCTGSWVENLYEGIFGFILRDFQILIAIGHIAPSGGVGQAIL